MAHRSYLVFMTGASGFIGTPLAAALAARGHRVRALVRPGSSWEPPPGVEVVHGDALDAASFAARVAPCDVFVQLVGVAHPSPSKARQFVAVDLAAARAGVEAATTGHAKHFVYLSVAQPAPVMRAYVEARARGEALVREAGLDATFVRPWYVLGPGRRWPLLLKPVYALLRALPATRDTARRLGTVTIGDMTAALVHAVENRPAGVRIIDVEGIRALGNGNNP